MVRSVLISLFLVAFLGVQAQEHAHQASDTTEEHHSSFRHHRIAVLLGHTRVLTHENGKGLLIPSWGFDYEYWFTPRWALGLHTDLELQTFVIRGEHEGDELERDYPLVLSLDALYNPWKGIILELGGGYEFERNQGFPIVQVGLEYEIHLPKGWDLFPTVFHDSRIGAYDTWTFAIGVGKRL